MNKSTFIETPVLIVGGGPVGLVLAIDLAWHGIRSVLVNREPETPVHPKGNSSGCRTMEHYRRLGIADAIRELGPPADYPRDVVFLTRLLGREIHRISHAMEREENRDSAVPEPTHRANQIYIEAFLKRHAESLEACDIRFGWTLVGFREGESKVDADVRHGATGRTARIRCDYLVGCDGARGAIRRGLGIAYEGFDTPELPFMSGQMLSAYVRIPGLRQAVDYEPAWQHWIFNADARATVFSLDGKDEYLILFKPRDDRTPEKSGVETFVNTLAGKTIEAEVISVKPWTAGFALVAGRFRLGRVFLAGDSAHLFTPTGGLGMNTGIEDAANLAWKLAAMLHGWGGDRLLDSYETERKPVAIRNTGIAWNYSQSLGRMVVPNGIEADGEEGERQRRLFAEFLSGEFHGQSDLIGTQLGARYDESPLIIADGSAPPMDDPVIYTPSACPGGRAPHLQFRDGSILFDHFGKGFSLLVLDGARDGHREGAAKLFEAAAGDRGIPLQVVRLDDMLVDMSLAHGLYERSLVLIRPDRHVAWRGDAAPTDVDGVLRRAAGWAW
uniref:2-polyprenyl-6-methoxyphenol hydroxylase n=1 Tax=Candidatus Kentrum sp. UNK TaxID=2126344 RepID=A0A451AJN4_9GAMM|nr:MAG: 2-polyprenyl-6-methoxyphenol hydroxylase [Candidatus Kentron sp. UNK]VFK71842.1 MAG: 2-polyprenyl-6-methoxyphenol hydroxylase [Candidatus Kentron sp. UNK]